MNENELKPEFVGITGLNPFVAHDSSSRSTMFSNHFSQRLAIADPDEKCVQSGLEKEISKYTFSISMPENGRIINIIERYPRGIGEDSLSLNPETVVIYEIDETKEIDYFTIPNFASYHQFFGFKYVFKEGINKIRPDAFIAKGTIFADSNSVSENGGFKYGINLNVAFMSVPAVSDDGLVISKDVLDRLKFPIYETRIVEFGSKNFPLNIYGSKDKYKPFPDIGEYINDTRGDGILMMLREYDSKLAPVDLSIYDTMEPDFVFDKAIYVRGGAGRVIDIKVISNNSRVKQLPDEVCSHIEKYKKAYLEFHKEIIKTEERLRYDYKRKYGENKLNVTPKLHNLLVESLAILNYNETKLKQPLNLFYRQTPIDEYMIEFTIEYNIKPNIGFKLTDEHGKK